MRESISPTPMTFAQYMQAELTSPVRHEFVRGEIFAMVGGTKRHNLIALNIATHLKAAQRGTACQTYLNDVKVRADTEVIYYPDVAVECGVQDGAGLIIDHARIVVEVTS